MKIKFSKHWKKSKQPRKKKKYKANAPLHIKRKFLSVNLSKELRKKHNKRNMIVVKGDKVKVSRGQFKKKSGKVEIVSLKRCKVYVTGIQIMKKEGSTILYPLKPSNLQIVELKIEDKKRQRILDRKKVKKTLTKKMKSEK